MKRIAGLLLAGMLMAGLVSACDDAPRGSCKPAHAYDADDCNRGLGDGNDEIGPLR